MKTISERLRRRLELRRSNAATPHGTGRKPDWLADYEAEIDHLEPGELARLRDYYDNADTSAEIADAVLER